MNNRLIQEFEDQTKNLNKGDRKKLKINVLKRLINKLEKDENGEIEQALEHLISQIPKPPVDRTARKSFKKSLTRLQKTVEKTFGYIEKGSFQGKYIGQWVGIGIALGVAFGAGVNNPGVGIAIGISIGAAIGTSVGASAEKKAENKGLVY